MFYVYWEKVGGQRELLVTATDVISAQFLAAKHSIVLAGAVTIYAPANGRPRVPLFIFHGGVAIGRLPPELASKRTPGNSTSAT
jgi:hypothetical protein